MDLLKACQRAGFVRIERDRRGGLRVFQGGALHNVTPRPSHAHGPLPQPDVEDTMDAAPSDAQPIEAVVVAAEPFEEQPTDIDPMPIDTTAELLGRAKPKPRARTARTAAAAARTPRAAKKPAARKTRAKKSGATDDAA